MKLMNMLSFLLFVVVLVVVVVLFSSFSPLLHAMRHCCTTATETLHVSAKASTDQRFQSGEAHDKCSKALQNYQPDSRCIVFYT